MHSAERIAAVLLVVGLTGCSTPPGASSGLPPADAGNDAGPSVASITPTAPPSRSSAPSPSAAFSADTIAVVVTTDLVVRSLPEISDRSTIDPVYLQDGQLVFVLAGPERANGFDWYRVVPFDRCRTCGDTPVSDPPPLLGWVAAADSDGEAWIEPLADPCTDPQSDPSHWRPGLIALACLGSSEVTVEGALAGCAGIVPGFVEPSWLAEGGCELTPPGFDPLEGGGIGPGNLTFHVPPGLAIPSFGPGGHLRVVGHIDDPASGQCSQTELGVDAVGPIPAEVVTLRCRAQLVAVEIQPLD